MIDITSKIISRREAVAEGKIFLFRPVLEKIKENKVPKGDVLRTAETAGLLAFKQTPTLIPHCHPVKITKGKLSFSFGKDHVRVRSQVVGIDRTGLEMEALSGVAVALLTIYDMCKEFDRQMELGEIKLIKKTGGKSDFGLKKRNEKKEKSPP